MDRHRFRLVFAEGPTLQEHYLKHSKWQRRKMLRHYPHIVFWLFGAWLIRTCTRSRASHILISSGEVVLDYQFSATKFWGHIDFCHRYPGILGYIDIYSDVPLMLERWEGRSKPDAWWRCLWTLARYLASLFTFGQISGQNCVTISRQVLAEAGFKVPKTAYSPAMFRRYLIDNGCDFIAGKPPAHDGPVD